MNLTLRIILMGFFALGANLFAYANYEDKATNTEQGETDQINSKELLKLIAELQEFQSLDRAQSKPRVITVDGVKLTYKLNSNFKKLLS